MLLEIPGGVRLGDGEEAVVKADFRVDGVRGADPVNGSFDFAPGGRAAGFALQIGGAAQFDDVARRRP